MHCTGADTFFFRFYWQLQKAFIIIGNGGGEAGNLEGRNKALIAYSLDTCWSE
jgi:hypothetical protein